MSIFSNLFQSIQEKIRENSAKKKEEQDFLRRLRVQAEQERRIAFEQEYLKNAKIVAISKAKKEAAEKSGLQKLRALNRAQRLQESSGEPTTFFDKLGVYTQKNLVKRDENMKRTAEQRKMAKEMREKRFSEQQRLRNERFTRNVSGSSFRK